MQYFTEHFSPEEHGVLGRFFTNTDGAVFALKNLPEVVKGALFARYSRTHKSLRRLFLDEFYTQPEIGIQAIAASSNGPGGAAGFKRAEDLYERVFSGYGDDSVAQLGGAHLACEQASNLLTKVLEWGRVAAYLEQSTRYIYFDRKLGDRFRYFIPQEVVKAGLGGRFESDMDWLFGTYSEIVRDLTVEIEARQPQRDSPRAAWQAAIRAQACDAARGLLPAATLSNVGIFATGQSYELMLLRMRGHPLQEARDYARLMLTELRQVIPAFLRRLDIPDRGGAWSAYLTDAASRTSEAAGRLEQASVPQRSEVTLVEWDPEAEIKIAAAALYAHSDLPDDMLLQIARDMSLADREALLRAYFGDRQNRRHKPGRALERCDYRFDVLCDFGAFRDLQRHRMLTIDWQQLSTRHGYEVPELIVKAGHEQRWHEAMSRMSDLHSVIERSSGHEAAQYAVPFAFRIRFVMQMNAREAMHMLELRTSPQGHPSYRAVCQEMYRQIRDRAGHRLLAEAMKYVDLSPSEGAGRLDAETRAALKEGLGR